MDCARLKESIRIYETKELGVCLPDGSKMMYASYPENNEIGDNWMRKHGYTSEYFSKGNKKIRILTQKHMASSFLWDLKNILGRNDKDGLIITVLQMEKLIGLIKFIVNLGEEMVTEFMKIFKGYCILEPIIRTVCLTQDGPIVRVSNSLALQIFGFSPTTYCDDMASNLYSMASQLDSEVRRNVGAISSQLMKIFKDFTEDLKEMEVTI